MKKTIVTIVIAVLSVATFAVDFETGLSGGYWISNPRDFTECKYFIPYAVTPDIAAIRSDTKIDILRFSIELPINKAEGLVSVDVKPVIVPSELSGNIAWNEMIEAENDSGSFSILFHRGETENIVDILHLARVIRPGGMLRGFTITVAGAEIDREKDIEVSLFTKYLRRR